MNMFSNLPKKATQKVESHMLNFEFGFSPKCMDI